MKNRHDTGIDTAAPWIARIPLSPDGMQMAHAIVHDGRAAAPAEGLQSVLDFHADGQGGWIAAAQAGDGGWGYIDGQARWRVPPTLESARSFSDDGVARFCQNGRWGFVNLAGEVVIAPAFEDTRPFRDGLCAVMVGKRAWRIIDRTGQFTCEQSFRDLSPFGAGGLARATGKIPGTNQLGYGFVDGLGRWVIEPRFKRAQPFGEQPATAASLDDEGNSYGLIDTRGQWVLEPRYHRIEAFNEDGLAYFDETDSREKSLGYLDARGQVAVRSRSGLSEYMACGVASNRYDGALFMRADGTPLPAPPLAYGSHFHAESGVAVVRTAPRRGESAPAAWGLLHTDGRVVTVGEPLLEPLTDAEGWLVGEQPGTPLLPFLARDGQVAFVDREGAVVWRVAYDGRHATLLDAGGQALWRSDAHENCRAPRPFFHAPATDHLAGMAAPEDIVPLAQALLAEAEANLRRLADGETLERESASDGRYQEGDDDDEDDEDTVQVNRVVVARCVARAYLSEQHHAPYEFLREELGPTMDQLHDAVARALVAHHGAPDPDPEHAVPRRHAGEANQAWAVPLAQALPGDNGVLRESREQWLTLYAHSDSGDGDMWWELWLVAAPSLDALETARRDGNGQGREEGSGDAALLEQLRLHPHTLADVRRERITDAMVDAAMAAREDAVRFVPRRLMTPARYAAALRQRIKQFHRIPPAMLSEEACIELVKRSGRNLEQVPEAWRTLAVCAHAVQCNSGAMEYVPEALRAQVPGVIEQLPPEGGDGGGEDGRGASL